VLPVTAEKTYQCGYEIKQHRYDKGHAGWKWSILRGAGGVGQETRPVARWNQGNGDQERFKNNESNHADRTAFALRWRLQTYTEHREKPLLSLRMIAFIRSAKMALFCGWSIP